MPTKTSEELLESGKFIWDVNRLILHPDFEAELYRSYPRQTIEDGLLGNGIAPADIGHHKIYWLKEKFERSAGRDTGRSMKKGRNAGYDATIVKQYTNHPYIQTATREKITLQAAFFEEAAVISSLPIDDIFRVFDIEPSIFSATERSRISRILRGWVKTDGSDVLEVIPTREILRNRINALDNIVAKGFLRIGDIVPTMNVFQRKALCLWNQELMADPGRKYTVKHILSLLGISRASYYAILRNENYGQAVIKRTEKDAQDAELIQRVMEYKGFAKGSRQIYMMLPTLTGQRLGLKKIRRIMKAYGITSSIRKVDSSNRMGGAALRKNVKPNLLKRRFRLHRPNRVRLTDVTYLTYGDGRRAYGSALLDPVSSRLIVG